MVRAPPTEPNWTGTCAPAAIGAVVGSPAKYNFDISASNCTDVMYFTVDQAGTASTVNVIAITNSYAGCPATRPARRRR